MGEAAIRPTVARVREAIEAHGLSPLDYSIVPRDSVPTGTDKLPRKLSGDPIIKAFEAATGNVLLPRRPTHTR